MAPYPKVLLMGLRKSGKSSIQRVVFEQMDPYETTQLATTVAAERSAHPYSSFLQFEVWDYPGQNDPLDRNHTSAEDIHQLLQNCGVIVFVMDCRETVDVPCARLIDTIVTANTLNKKGVYIEVFLHKVDVLSEDHQNDLLHYLEQKVEMGLRERLPNTPYSRFSLSYNLTSIYDHSVFHAFSLVVQRLISEKLPFVTELLQFLNSHCLIDASFLFLKQTKIFLAKEAQRSDMGYYDLCSDAVEVLGKMSSIYDPNKLRADNVLPLTSSSSLSTSAIRNTSASDTPRLYSHSGVSRNNSIDNVENCMDDDSNGGGDAGDLESQALTLRKGGRSTTYLDQGNCIYVRELPNSLTIAAVLKVQDLQMHKVLIDENITTFYQRAFRILHPG